MLSARGYRSLVELLKSVRRKDQLQGVVIERATSLDRRFSYRCTFRFMGHSVRWKPTDARVSFTNGIFLISLDLFNFFFFSIFLPKYPKVFYAGGRPTNS